VTVLRPDEYLVQRMEVSNRELEPEHELLGSVAGDGILESLWGKRESCVRG
jgi:hypothetical protein